MVAFIGLTGGIGAGKSTALEAIGRLGAATLSTDAIVHDLYDSPEVRDAVVARLGPSVLRGDSIDRAAVASLAFATAADRSWLEGLLWPLVRERMAAWRAQVDAASPPPQAAVVEVPLLFESGMESAFDATIAVIAEEQVRARRAGARGHEALAQRSARQLSQQEKAHRATYKVINDGTVEQLEDQLSAVLEMLH